MKTAAFLANVISYTLYYTLILCALLGLCIGGWYGLILAMESTIGTERLPLIWKTGAAAGVLLFALHCAVKQVRETAGNSRP